MTDAILFSANPSMVEFDDVTKHLQTHKELYWSVPFPVVKAHLSFPLFGFIHVSGRQVEYRVLITDIVPFSSDHYADPELKPKAWRDSWEAGEAAMAHKWKNALVISEIVEFSFDTYSIEKRDGGKVTHPPQNYIRIVPPNESSPSVPQAQSPVSIAEKNLEDFVIQQLEIIEPGLELVSRQLTTPAGRIDLLCRDVHGNYVIVELKSLAGADKVVGQTLRYMGWATDEYPNVKIRGIIVVGKKDDALRYALKAVSNIEAKEFKLSIA